MGSRFEGIGRVQAWLIAFALAMAIVVSVLPNFNEAPQSAPAPIPAPAAQIDTSGDDADLTLYNTIINRVAAGENYYAAAAEELRKGSYPLRPFVTFRLPTLAWLSAALGPNVMTGLLWLLIGGAVWAWWQQLGEMGMTLVARTAGLLLVTSGLSLGLQPIYLPLHELWSGVLIAIAFALHRPQRWWPSLILAAMALLVRELALPFVLLMGALALLERRWREGAGWAGLVAGFCVVMMLHASQIGPVVQVNDLQSPGWATLGGPDAFLRVMRLTSGLRIFPDVAANALTLLALFGWIAWRQRAALIGALLFCGYGLLFMLAGRPDNFYWGLMIAPAFLLGLVAVPAAFRDLTKAMRA
jgi:hypothetical protein